MKKLNLTSKQIGRIALIPLGVLILALVLLMIFLPAELKTPFALGFIAVSVAAILAVNNALRKGKEQFVALSAYANLLLLLSAIALCVVSSLK